MDSGGIKTRTRSRTGLGSGSPMKIEKGHEVKLRRTKNEMPSRRSITKGLKKSRSEIESKSTQLNSDSEPIQVKEDDAMEFNPLGIGIVAISCSSNSGHKQIKLNEAKTECEEEKTEEAKSALQLQQKTEDEEEKTEESKDEEKTKGDESKQQEDDDEKTEAAKSELQQEEEEDDEKTEAAKSELQQGEDEEEKTEAAESKDEEKTKAKAKAEESNQQEDDDEKTKTPNPSQLDPPLSNVIKHEKFTTPPSAKITGLRNSKSQPINIKLKTTIPNIHHESQLSTFKTPISPPLKSVNIESVSSEPEDGRLQSLVDLVMWRDVSRSALVFGIGTFIIISSSYTKDLDISLISAGSYLGLLYLAIVFLYKSIMCRGIIDERDSPQINIIIGEEEALWLLKLVLPFLNEFLLKLGRLFSGDPAVTMKLALLLFALARCGGSITIWQVVKLGFFGVFVIPKLCSAYSSQIAAYGKFWFRRFQDAWLSCSHKKAVAFAVFTLVWKFSSVVARAWAAFMLFVTLRCYQQSLVTNNWVDDQPGPHDLQQGFVRQRRRHVPRTADLRKAKKSS